MVCPLIGAWRLHKALPASKLVIVPEKGACRTVACAHAEEGKIAAFWRFSFAARMKFECQRINAETVAGQSRAVVKNMAQMRMAVGAANFGPGGAVTVIGHHFDTAGNSGVKARPAAAAVKFLVRRKDGIATAGHRHRFLLR